MVSDFEFFRGICALLLLKTLTFFYRPPEPVGNESDLGLILLLPSCIASIPAYSHSNALQ